MHPLTLWPTIKGMAHIGSAAEFPPGTDIGKEDNAAVDE